MDRLQPGDAIVIRSQDYWYVYQYTNYTIVTPDDGSVIGPEPRTPGRSADQAHDHDDHMRAEIHDAHAPLDQLRRTRILGQGGRRYSQELAWARAPDGAGAKFVNNEKQSFFTSIGSPRAVRVVRSPSTRSCSRPPSHGAGRRCARAIREGRKPLPDADIYGWLLRHSAGRRAGALAARAAARVRRGVRAVPVGIPVGCRQYRVPQTDVELR